MPMENYPNYPLSWKIISMGRLFVDEFIERHVSKIDEFRLLEFKQIGAEAAQHLSAITPPELLRWLVDVCERNSNKGDICLSSLKGSNAVFKVSIFSNVGKDPIQVGLR